MGGDGCLTGRRAASADAAPVTISVTFKPRNAALLERLAATQSGAQGLTSAELVRLFGPSRSELGGTSAYLRGHGLRPTGGGILTRSYAGSVADTEAAFATQLESYRSGGVSFRAPASTPTLPAALASGVLAISGLDTYPLATSVLAPRAAPVIRSSAAVHRGRASTPARGGYEPAQLASASAYNSQPLLDQGASGAGNAVALVEFSNYSAAPVQTSRTAMAPRFPSPTWPSTAAPPISPATSRCSSTRRCWSDRPRVSITSTPTSRPTAPRGPR